MTLKSLVLEHRYPNDRMEDLWAIVTTFHADMFPNFLKLVAVALTLPVHTADCERGFSLQNQLKNCERNQPLPKRLDNLVLTLAEGPPVAEFVF